MGWPQIIVKITETHLGKGLDLCFVSFTLSFKIHQSTDLQFIKVVHIFLIQEFTEFYGKQKIINVEIEIYEGISCMDMYWFTLPN